MKLVRYGPPGKEKPGLMDADGKLRDLSRKVKDINGASLAPAEIAKLRKLDPRKLPLVKGRPRLGPCIATPSKFVAIGLNYSDHAKESGNPIPEHPVVFFKSPTCIVGANDNVVQGNFIGTNAAGTAAVPDVVGGIFDGGASNTIGGSTGAIGTLGIAAFAGNHADFGTDKLHGGHHGKRNESCPKCGESERGAGDRVSSDARRVVVRGAGDEPGPQ